MKKLIVSVALMTALALVFFGCDTDADSTTGTVGGLQNIDIVKIDVDTDTLIHETPKLLGVNHFGNNLGKNNDDGSYTFNGTAGAWSGGGAQYTFPTPKAGDTWKISDYNCVELYLKTTDGKVSTRSKKSGNANDLLPYVTSGSTANDVTFDADTSGGVLTRKYIIGEAGTGVGFQRNGAAPNTGPATVAIEKVVFSKVLEYTVTFDGGTYTMPASVTPIKVPTGRPLNFNGSYVVSIPPVTDQGKTYVCYAWKKDGVDYAITTPITSDITLTAQWAEPPDMHLDLDPANWPSDMPTQNVDGLKSGPTGNQYTHPLNFATATYDSTEEELTLVFDGSNRQRAIIPLNEEQIDMLMMWTDQITFRIVGEVNYTEDDTLEFFDAQFRCHLVNPTVIENWNGTNTGTQGPIANHWVEVASFSGNKSEATLAYFAFQAMYQDNEANPDNKKDGFPAVTLIIKSIEIQLGNTNL